MQQLSCAALLLCQCRGCFVKGSTRHLLSCSCATGAAAQPWGDAAELEAATGLWVAVMLFCYWDQKCCAASASWAGLKLFITNYHHACGCTAHGRVLHAGTGGSIICPLWLVMVLLLPEKSTAMCSQPCWGFAGPLDELSMMLQQPVACLSSVAAVSFFAWWGSTE